MTLQVCHMCRRVSDSSESEQRWVTKEVYQERTGYQVLLGAIWCQQYCPECLKYLSGYRKAA